MKNLRVIIAIALMQTFAAGTAQAVSQIQINGTDHNNTVATCSGIYAGNPPSEGLLEASCQIESGAGAVTYDGLLYVTIYTDDAIFPWVCSGITLQEMSCSRNSGPSGG